MNHSRPLEGIRVVEFTMYAAGSCCGRVLASLGAEVIKVEPPSGDVYRYMGVGLGAVATEDENPVYDVENEGKQSIALNLHTAEAQSIVGKLLEQSDVLITNYRDDALQRFGLTYDNLKEKYPKLVYGLVDGFGEQGPDAGRPGYDVSAYWARSGMLGDFTEPGAALMSPMGASGDHNTGIALAAGILAALFGAQRTGRGEKVTASLYHAAIWALGTLFVGTQYGDRYPKSRHNPAITPINHTYRCKDGEWFVLMALDLKKHWPALCKAIGREDLLQELKLGSYVGQKQNAKELVTLLDETFSTRDYEEWKQIFLACDVPIERVCHMREVPGDEQARVNHFIDPITYPSGKTVYLSTPPLTLSDAGPREIKRAAKLGEHTAEVLQGLGYSPELINQLKTDKVVLAR